MGNFTQQAEAGIPGISMRWRSSVNVITDIQKTPEGRYLCRIKVDDGEFFNLPGTHPTEVDAEQTLEAYITKNMK